MNILIIGSGAREHAIAKAFHRSPKQPTVYCYGNSHHPGIRELSKYYLMGNMNDVDAMTKFAKECKAKFVIVGPEAPLEKGIADALWKENIFVIGPTQKLAQIETSKSFARDLLKKYRISGSPLYQVFHDLSGAKEFLQRLGDGCYVIKANGLMGGKGVKVAGDHLHSLDEAYHFCEELYRLKHSFVIEEKCVGEEFSFMCFSDGKHLVPMPLVQDHKRAFINDKGPNTGGMGSYSDSNHRLPFLTDKDVNDAFKINQAVMNALEKECGEKYIGILYGSFMATKQGVRVIEFNARFGDPEAMNVLAILKTDLVDICEGMISEKLSSLKIVFEDAATVCKYAVPKGYPDHPQKNSLIDVGEIKNPEQLYLAAIDECDGKLYTTTSRAVAVVGIADTIFLAEKIAEMEMQRIKGELFHREDIGTEKLINQRISAMQTLRAKVHEGNMD